MNTNTEIKTLEAAIEEAYPIPDSPHTSVLMRAADAQVAFTKGWEARDDEAARLQAALADRDAKQVQGELPPLPDGLLGAYIASCSGAGFMPFCEPHFTTNQMQSYARAAIAQRVGCGEPVAYIIKSISGVSDSGSFVSASDADCFSDSSYSKTPLYRTPPAAVTDAEHYNAVLDDVVALHLKYLSRDTVETCGYFMDSILAMKKPASYEARTSAVTDADKRDAGRYRFWRVSAAMAMTGLHSEKLDAAIDAAIAASEQEGK